MVSDFSHYALWLAGLATVAQAYTTPVGATPSGNPIAKPGLNEIVPVNAPYAITWSPTTSECSTVDLVLLRGPSNNIVPLYAIVENVANTGSYSWTPSASLEPDTTHYGIQLICDQSGAYQYTTQFGISNPGYTGASSSSSSSSLAATSTRSVYLASSSSIASIVSSSAGLSSIGSSTSHAAPSTWSTTVLTHASSGFPVPGNSTVPMASGTISHKPSSSAHKPTTRTTVLTHTNTPTTTGSSGTTAAQGTVAAPTGTNGATVARAAFGLIGAAAAAVFAL